MTLDHLFGMFHTRLGLSGAATARLTQMYVSSSSAVNILHCNLTSRALYIWVHSRVESAYRNSFCWASPTKLCTLLLDDRAVVISVAALVVRVVEVGKPDVARVSKAARTGTLIVPLYLSTRRRRLFTYA